MIHCCSITACLCVSRDEDEVLRCQRAYKNILTHVPGLSKLMTEYVDSGDLTGLWDILQKVRCVLLTHLRIPAIVRQVLASLMMHVTCICMYKIPCVLYLHICVFPT